MRFGKKGFSGQSSLANDYNWCKYNTAFADYFTSQGIDVTDVLSEVATSATKIGENVLGAAKTASTIPQTLLNILKWLIPVLLIIGAIIAIIYFGKKYNVIKA